MTTATKTKTTPPPAPPTFATIARKKMRERVERYRQFVKRHVEGEALQEADLVQVSDLLEGLGLPDFAWPRDIEALQRANAASVKFKAALDAEPTNRERSVELAKEIADLKKKLQVVAEEHRRAIAATGKSAAYGHTLEQLSADHPHLLADTDTAVTLRLDELNRRKREGVS